MKYFERWPLVSALVITVLITLIIKTVFVPQFKPDFASITDIKEKKSQFLNYINQQVQVVNEAVREQRNRLVLIDSKVKLSSSEKAFIIRLAKQYRVVYSSQDNTTDLKSVINQLMVKVDQIPPALILAQAANESAWGTSRFARQANNYFGIWCFSKGCGIVPAARNENQIHEVRSFYSAKESVAYYVQLLNSHKTYKALRLIRSSIAEDDKVNSANQLAQGLMHYSERGEAYIKDLLALIRFNKLNEKYPLN